MSLDYYPCSEKLCIITYSDKGMFFLCWGIDILMLHYLHMQND